jgi:hypothetical protein
MGLSAELIVCGRANGEVQVGRHPGAAYSRPGQAEGGTFWVVPYPAAVTPTEPSQDQGAEPSCE